MEIVNAYLILVYPMLKYTYGYGFCIYKLSCVKPSTCIILQLNAHANPCVLCLVVLNACVSKLFVFYCTVLSCVATWCTVLLLHLSTIVIKHYYYYYYYYVIGSEYDSDENVDLAEKDDILEQEAGDADDVGPEEDLRNQVHRVHLWVLLLIVCWNS